MMARVWYQFRSTFFVLPFFCFFNFWITLFSKISKKLALFDSYYWPFYKPHAKINDILLICVIRDSIWKLFIKFPWHGEKPTSATLVTLSSISCHTVVMQFSGTHWDFLSKFLSLNYYTIQVWGKIDNFMWW